MFHKTSPQRYSNIFSAFQFLFPPLTPDLPLPSSPQSDVKLICQMSSRLYTLAHRFPTISNQFAALLESLLSTKKTLLFSPSMINVPSALTVDSCLLKNFLNYKKQFIRFVSPLPYNLWDDGLLLGIAEHSSWTLKQSSSLRQLRWNSPQTNSKRIRLGLRVALTRVVSQ